VEGNNRNNQWWAWEQQGGNIRDGTTSGLACDHYNRFEEDFALAEELGHNAHRLSIEWSRIEPEEGCWDEEEVEHYRRVMEYASMTLIWSHVSLLLRKPYSPQFDFQ
jgi:beta-glucosidase